MFRLFFFFSAVLFFNYSFGSQYKDMEACYDSDRAFLICPENQTFQKYNEKVLSALAQGKSALIVFGYDDCSWCTRIISMFYTSPTWKKLRDSTVLVPISTRTYARTDEGKFVFSRNKTALEYLESLEIDPGDSGVPHLYLVNSNQTVYSLSDEMEAYEQNYFFHRQDEDGNLLMREDGSRPLKYSFQGYKSEEIVRLLLQNL